ncbi:unnamed protein product [Adineta steineri]|uniref:Uncharacterized protein n=1 Tax=Adineta steineri TaxID=433720 RepID=A0A816GEU7_9BILA|nr:unnamed protein product [Adineta steineri]CAF1579868.1 unnamed protein product [Adineta steineri]CAF1673243.1 unnamed protein product [Adineta steineri]CAF1673250.1 unnamed protein product [Adineta steineri]
MDGVAVYANVLSNRSDSMGWVIHNTNKDKFAKYGLDEYNLAPGQLLFHPGPNNTRACIRFTVPSADTYHIDAVFFTTAGPEIPGPSTDIHLSVNNVELRSLWLKRNTGRFTNLKQIDLARLPNIKKREGIIKLLNNKLSACNVNYDDNYPSAPELQEK